MIAYSLEKIDYYTSYKVIVVKDIKEIFYKAVEARNFVLPNSFGETRLEYKLKENPNQKEVNEFGINLAKVLKMGFPVYFKKRRENKNGKISS